MEWTRKVSEVERKQLPCPAEGIEQFLLSFKGKPLEFSIQKCFAPFGIDESFDKKFVSLALDPDERDVANFIERWKDFEEAMAPALDYKLISSYNEERELLKTSLRTNKSNVITKLITKGQEMYFSFLNTARPLRADLQIGVYWINHKKKEYGLKLMFNCAYQ